MEKSTTKRKKRTTQQKNGTPVVGPRKGILST
jgi:hypothetical protein